MSQGRAGGGGVAAGQATIVWDDFGSRRASRPVPLDIIGSDRIGNATSFAGIVRRDAQRRDRRPHHDQHPDRGLRGAGQLRDHGKVTVRLAVTHAAVNELSFSPVSPGGTVFPLLIAANATFGVTGANIGFGPAGGTNFLMTLDSDALRTPNNGPGPYLGTFAPSANLNSAAIRAEAPTAPGSSGSSMSRPATPGPCGSARSPSTPVAPGNDATIASRPVRGQQGLGGLTASAAAPSASARRR